MVTVISVPKAILSVSDVSSLLGCSNYPIYKLIRQGKLEIIPGGKRYRITAQSVKDYINSKSVRL